jgi:hypothetical protein
MGHNSAIPHGYKKGQAGIGVLNAGKSRYMSLDAMPFPAPAGFRWVFVTQFTHWRSKKIIKAEEHGRKAFCFLVPIKKAGS